MHSGKEHRDSVLPPDDRAGDCAQSGSSGTGQDDQPTIPGRTEDYGSGIEGGYQGGGLEMMLRLIEPWGYMSEMVTPKCTALEACVMVLGTPVWLMIQLFVGCMDKMKDHYKAMK
jgi:hypothetical protein